jgi:hypothetical protein
VSGIVVLDAWAADDPATVVSHHLASGAAERLSAARKESPSRAEVEVACGAHEGAVLFGHGTYEEGGAYVSPGPARVRLIDSDNVEVLDGRWCFAVACWLGKSLAATAAAAGSTCFAAYDVALNVGWDHATLPRAIGDALTSVVSVIPQHLAAGERDERKLRRAISDASERLIELLIEHETDGLALYAFANAMVSDLVIRMAARGA